MPFKKFLSATMLAAMMILPGQAIAGELLVKKQSPHTVAVTLDRLSKILQSKGLTIFARVDHAAGAQKVGMKMLPTQLLIFGNPKAGTPLMMSNRTIGIDLPLKALAWRDEAGKVWLAYTSPAALKQRYNITDRDKVFGKITGALGKLTDAALKAN